MTFEDFDRLIEQRRNEAGDCFRRLHPSGIDYLTPEEREQLHQLKLALPTYGEQVAAAKQRIQERIRSGRRGLRAAD